MQHTKHGAHLVRLTRLRAVNCYLVAEDDGLTLVDTSIPGSAGPILTAARQLGAPIRRIVLTHAHGDHVGGLARLVAELPDVEVMLGAREARLLAGDKSLDQDEPAGKLRGVYPQVSVTPSRRLEAGERVGSLEVLPSPGHTPGHICLLDARDGTLIAGDAFQTLGGVAVAGVVRPAFPFPALGTWHKPTAASSARALHARQPSRLAVGHGAVLEAPLEAMALAISEAA